MIAASSIIELRQYTLHPGRRDELIALFEREFVDSQEAVGIRLTGLFRDLDDPDRFVWLRGFADMQARRRALSAFYSGPVWATHREAANATMIDSDDVLLLRPALPEVLTPPSQAADPTGEGLIVVGIHHAPAQAPDTLSAALRAAGLRPLSIMVTEPAENTFPRLPVRTDGPFLVWLARASDSTRATVAGLGLAEGTSGAAPHFLRLAPTARSALRA